MKIKPLFIPLKNVNSIKPTHSESAHNGQLQRLSSYQLWKNVGLREKVYARQDLDAVYDTAENFWETIESRLITSVLLVDPTYVPRGATVASAGDKFSAIRHDLRVAIRGLFKSYATRSWQWVSIYSVNINKLYLRHYRALHGQDVKYYNHDMIVCGDVFVAPENRTPFGRVKNKGSK